ncbi:Copper-transporting ATPase PAA1, chloroplastic [Capsicum chinense]|nr:Copper-transporting ATPase PAA1, chloroplastic [Capsicum chinense]
MTLSATTFMFWNLFIARLLPPALCHGSAVSLALQLSFTMLVIACSCALGLATPTATMVGTSLGATKGLLLHGENVLERFLIVDTIVFDKTGTLTIGRPTMTKVVSQGQGHQEDTDGSVQVQISVKGYLVVLPGHEHRVAFWVPDLGRFIIILHCLRSSRT